MKGGRQAGSMTKEANRLPQHRTLYATITIAHCLQYYYHRITITLPITVFYTIECLSHPMT